MNRALAPAPRAPVAAGARTLPVPDTGGRARPRPGSATAGRLPWPVWLYLFCLMVPIGFSLGPLAMNTLRLLLVVMTVPLMLRVLRGACGGVLATDILFVLHVLWAGVALAVNNPDRVIEQTGSVGVEFLGGYAIGRVYIRDSASFLALARALVAIVLVLFPFVLFEALTGRPPILEILRRLPGLRTSPILAIGSRMGLERVQAVFLHPIHFGLFCSLVLPLAFVARRGLVGDGWRLLSSGVTALSGFLALSSGALLAILLQLGLFAWSALLAGVRHRWWLLVGLFALLYVAIDLLSTRSPIRVFMSYATFSPHTAYWRSIIFEWGMVNVRANPVFGLGLNDWVRPSYMSSGSMDNFWLVMAVRYGIPGFATVALGVLVAMARIMRRDFGDDAVLLQIRRAWVFAFVGLSFTLCTVHVWSSIYSFAFMMFGAGVWLILAEPGPAATPAATPAAAPAPVPAGPVYSRFPPGKGRRPLQRA